MRFQVKSQTTPIVNREAAEVTLVLGKLIPMTGDVPFQIEFLVSAIRAGGCSVAVEEGCISLMCAIKRLFLVVLKSQSPQFL